MAKITDKTVKSKYPPKQTNVTWIDTSQKPAVTKSYIDGQWVVVGGGGGGTKKYSDLEDKPLINGVELNGNKTSQDLGVYSKPSSGIPQSDLSSDVQSQLNKHFKGWYASSSTLPSNPVVGDYAYVKGASSTDPAAIYECTTAGTWSDSGRTADTSNVQTFASGEDVNEISIDNDFVGGYDKIAGAEEVKELGEDLYGKPAWKSQASISLTPGMSTSSLTKYSFDNVPILYANKIYQLDIVIQNNAINNAILYLKNSGGTATYFSTDGNRTISRGITDGYSAELTLEDDIYYASFGITDVNIANSGDIIVKITEKNSGTTGLKDDVSILKDDVSILKDDVENLKDETQDLQNQINSIRPSVSGGERKSGDTLSKEIISLTRPYYFSQGWSVNDNFGYLDDVLASVPEGKHFLIYTDIHLDYINNFGLSQKQPIIMKYVQERLRGCKVIFCGDVIGSQATELAAKKEIRYFSDENYALFGADFIPVLGDHDTDKVNGGLTQGNQLTEEFLYENYFKQSYIYGTIQDTLGIAAIDNIASFNADKKAAWKNYMRMHYYVDDVINKIRFIVIQEGAVFRTITSNFNTSAVQLPFIAKSILDAPNDYDIVVVGHEFQIAGKGASTASIWEKQLGLMLSAFKNGSTYTLSHPYQSDEDEIAVWNAVADVYDSTFDYSSKTGNTVILQGDEHFDCANYFNASTMQSNLALPEYTKTSSDVLRIIFDRACLVENFGFPTSTFTDINTVMKGFRRAVAQYGDVTLLGTTNEVLFDIVTLTSDGKIVLTRVGDKPVAGKAGLYPVFSEESNYNVDDIVIYYEIVESNYIIKAYKFTSSHSAGAWNTSEVDEYIVTEPYVRTFDLR